MAEGLGEAEADSATEAEGEEDSVAELVVEDVAEGEDDGEVWIGVGW